MASPVIQFKRGVIANLPALRAGEPGFTTDSYDLYVGIDSTTNNNKYLGSARYWTKETASSATVLKLLEASGNGTSNIGLRAPASVGSDLTYTLPGTATDGYFLKTDATGTLSWTGTIVAAGDDHDLAGTTDLDEVSVSGFSTFSKNVDVAGITSTQDLYVAGISTFVGACTFKGGTVTLGDATTDNVVFTSDVNSNIIPNTDGAYDLGSSSQQWRDLFINGTVDADSLVVSGVSTLGGFVDINDSVNISDGLEVTGFSTFTKFVDINESVDISGGLNVSGIVTASSFVGDGANLTGIDATAVQTGTTKLQTSAPGISNEVGGLGIGTFSGAGLNVTGVVTATSFSATSFSGAGAATFAGPLNVGNELNAGSGVNVYGGGSIYIRQTGTGSADKLLILQNDNSTEVANLNGAGGATFAGAVKTTPDITSEVGFRVDYSNPSGETTYLGLRSNTVDYAYAHYDGSALTSCITLNGNATFAGQMLLNVNNPTYTQGINLNPNNVGGSTISIYSSGSSSQKCYVVYDGTDNSPEHVVIKGDGSATFAGVISADAGIDFSGISSTADSGSVDNNLLDDYEEGTFLPNAYGASSTGTTVYSLQYGAYVKIGRICHIQIRLSVTSMTGTGDLYIGGLPFLTMNDANRGFASISVPYISNLDVPSSNDTYVGAYTQQNSTHMVMGALEPGAGYNQVEVQQSFVVLMGGTYMTDA